MLLPGASRSLNTDGWFNEPHCYLTHPDYRWEESGLRNLLKSSSDIVSFCERFFSPALEATGADLWVEKSPSNVYTFRHFLEAFDNGRVIHVCRNPYDTIASLVKRGFSSFHAAGNWIYDNAAALSVSDSPRYLRIAYEDFVKTPEAEISRITNFLGVRHELRVLEPGKNEEINHTRNPGWNFERTGRIESGSVSRFVKLDDRLKTEIATALSVLRISDRHATTKQMRHQNAAEISLELGYEFAAFVAAPARRLTRWRMMKDFMRRSVIDSQCRFHMYPFEIF